ncbi:single-stranded DNA-binding protein, helix-destabilizing [Desulfonema limicola]|uniref:Single-stranded DNA-binding protein n=1 Tax=Desulfonema limicola TaxID=45656 RepID=A0A975GEW8_9BACT|nr:single-stranded DNA-binding protein [Desulfonema limicola]QTA78657.1 single-stranded DNA-binding protein, helix-destabilizing [Desulfonema limicola]
MAGMSKAVIIGHLGRDPEVRYTPDGLAVTNFSVAATEKIKGVDQTQWFKVTAFGKLGEICGQYLSKGRQVYIDGRLQTSEWEDQEGKKRFTLEVIASNMQMLGSRADAAPQGGGYGPPPGGGYQNQPPYQGGGYGPPPGSGYQNQPPYQGGGYGPPPGGGYQNQPPYQGGGYGPPPGSGYQNQPPYQGGGYQGTPAGDPGYSDQDTNYPEPDNYQESSELSSSKEDHPAPSESAAKDDTFKDKSDMGGNQADNVPDDDDIPF